MNRLIIISAILSFIIVASSFGAFYYLFTEQSGQADRNLTKVEATGISRIVTNQVTQQISTIERIASSPETAQLILSSDPVAYRLEAGRLCDLIPDCLRIRFLPLTIESPIEDDIPHMGFADLEMVFKSKSGAPSPAAHSLKTPHQHIAIARSIKINGESAAVILASFSLKPIEEAILAATRSENGIFQILQGGLQLALHGDQAALKTAPEGVLPIAKTAWKLRYWTKFSGLNDPTLLILITVATLTLLLLLFFLASRWLSSAIKYDQLTLAEINKLSPGKRESAIKRLKLKESAQLIGKTGSSMEKLSTVEKTTDATTEKVDLTKEPEQENSQAPEVGQLSGFLPQDNQGIEFDDSIEVPDDIIFKPYGISGIVGETLTDEIAILIGQSIGSEAYKQGHQQIVVGRNISLTSPDLSAAVIKGLQMSGRDVVDLGMIPTPIFYFALEKLDLRCGVMVTGGQNVSKISSLRVVLNGQTASSDQIIGIKDRICERNMQNGNGSVSERDLTQDYVAAVIEDTQVTFSMKIVVDAGNGSTGIVAPLLLKSLECEVIELYSEPDGHFPNHPADPNEPANLVALIEAVTAEQADLGIAFNSAGDRIGVVDDKGKIIWPDRLLMLFASEVLSQHPASDIVYDVNCSRHLAGAIVGHGGRPVMWKSSTPQIRSKMIENNAMLGGSFAGHILFKDRWLGSDDALYASARLLEALSQQALSSSEVFAGLPESDRTATMRIDVPGKKTASQLMKQINQLADFKDAKVTTIDGLRVDFHNGWGLVKASDASTSELSLRFEADDSKALKEIQHKFQTLLKSVKSDKE